MATKLGPHNLTPNADALRLVRAGAPIVKLVNDFGAGIEYLNLNPNLILVGRRISTFPDDPSRVVTGENLRHIIPEDAARLWVDIQSETYRLNPHIFIWEGPNEPAWQDLDDMRWYGAFEAERVILIASRGLRAVVGNFSVGTPHIQENDVSWWNAFAPALFAAQQHGGYLGLHEYEFGPLTGAGGWLFLRYRKVHDWFLMRNGLGALPILLTEFGVDFKNFNFDYAAELEWADRQMRQDSYLHGATIFTFGSTNQAWDAFNVDGSIVTTPLVNYMERVRNDADPLPDPTPEPDPIPDPTPIPTPEPTMPIVFSDNFTTGGNLFPGTDNLFVPLGYDLAFREGRLSPDLPEADPNSEYLKPEGKFRIATEDVPLYGHFAEALPPEEVALYLNRPDFPVAYHLFKLHGKMWIWLERGIVLPAGNYTFRVKLYSDIYTGAHVFDNNPLSGEWRIYITGLPPVEFDNILTNNIPGRWRQLSRTFDHPGGELRHGIEFRERFGVEHVGILLREWQIIENAPTPIPSSDIIARIRTARDTAQSLTDQLNSILTDAPNEFVNRAEVLREAEEVVALLRGGP